MLNHLTSYCKHKGVIIRIFTHTYIAFIHLHILNDHMGTKLILIMQDGICMGSVPEYNYSLHNPNWSNSNFY